MIWTDDQNNIWDVCRKGNPPRISGDQTPQQAVNLAVDGFINVCHFDGVEPPSREAVEARMREEFSEAFTALGV